MLFSCKRVSAIISINPLERSAKERFILNYHKLICKACHNYQYQNTIIEKTLRDALKADDSMKLSEEKKEKIIALINDESFLK